VVSAISHRFLNGSSRSFTAGHLRNLRPSHGFVNNHSGAAIAPNVSDQNESRPTLRLGAKTGIGVRRSRARLRPSAPLTPQAFPRCRDDLQLLVVHIIAFCVQTRRQSAIAEPTPFGLGQSRLHLFAELPGLSAACRAGTVWDRHPLPSPHYARMCERDQLARTDVARYHDPASPCVTTKPVAHSVSSALPSKSSEQRYEACIGQQGRCSIRVLIFRD